MLPEITKHSYSWLALGALLLLCCATVRAQESWQYEEVERQLEGTVGDIEMLATLAARRQALARLQEITELRRREGANIYLSLALNRLARVHLKLYNPDAAAQVVSESLTVAQTAQDERLLVDARNTAAEIYLFRNETERVLELVAQTEAASRKLNYRRGLAQSLTWLCAAYFQTAELEKAADAGEKAVALWRELQDRRGTARALYHLGEAYLRPDPQKSTDTFAAALVLWRELGDKDEEASVLLDLNFIAIRASEWRKALAALQQAQSLIIEEDAEPFLAGQIAGSFGVLYRAFGELETALYYYEKALVLYRDKAHSVEAEAQFAREAGFAQALLGRHELAQQQLNHALALSRRLQNARLEAITLEELGRAARLRGDFAAARDYLQRASDYLHKIASWREAARADTELGRTFAAQQQYPLAERAYLRALRVYQNTKDDANEAWLRFEIGKLYLAQGRLAEAGPHLEKSIALTEELRDYAASAELRIGFLAFVHERYETYLEWLMQSQQRQPDKQLQAAAFEASEQSHARSLLEALQTTEITQGVDPGLLAEAKNLRQQLAYLAKKINGAKVAPELLDEQRRLAARWETVQAQIRETAPAYAHLTRPPRLKLQEIQQTLLDDDTVLLEYALGERQSYLWVVTRHDIAGYTLPGRAQLEPTAMRLHRLLAGKPTSESAKELAQTAQELSRLVLAPVAGSLANNKKVLIVADGALHYVPFQLLSDAAGAPLITQHEIINAPSASVLWQLEQPRPDKKPPAQLLTAFGNPVFPSNFEVYSDAVPQPFGSPASDNTASNNAPASRTDSAQRDVSGLESDSIAPDQVPPLPYAPIELERLRFLAGDCGAVIASEFEANRARLQSENLSQYSILHFATHGYLNTERPDKSGLMLSLLDPQGRRQEGFLGLSDVYNLRAPVDLVVLSACRTALGKEVRGEGLISLTRGFMYAGASSVVASLWSVNAAATTSLMEQFYANMLQKDMMPAQALREAQNYIRQQPQWREPYYWAGFTLQGEFRRPLTPLVIPPTPRRNPLYWVGAGLLAILLTGLGWRIRASRRRRVGFTPTP